MPEEKFQCGNTGAVFKDNTLIIFQKRSVTVVHPWPKPMAWVKTQGNPSWRPCRPKFNASVLPADKARPERGGKVDIGRGGWGPEESGGQMLLPFPPPPKGREERSAEAFEKWFEPVPTEVLRYLRGFEKRTYHILALFARVPDAWDLRDNRALVYCLASAWVFNRSVPSRRCLEYARRWVKWRRRRIAEALGWPGKESIVRMLAKVPDESLSIETLLYLRDAVRERGNARLLSHLQRINRGVVLLVSLPAIRAAVTPKLLNEVSNVAEEDDYPKTGWLAEDCLAMLYYLGALRGIKFRSREAVQALHDELTERLDIEGPTRFLGSFPAPPLPGSDTIVPITEPVELAREGREMHHCVASYAHRVASGKVYLYKVLAPERATLSIRRRGRRWVLEQLRCACNEEPSHSTYAAVARWLAKAQGKDENLHLEQESVCNIAEDDIPF